MTKAFDSIKQGLQEAIAHAEGRAQGARVHRPHPVDVKELRAKVDKPFNGELIQTVRGAGYRIDA